MNKKLLKIGIPILLLIGVISFYLIKNYLPKSFESLLGTDVVNITKVSMREGKGLTEVETTDKEKINELLDLVNDRYYRKCLIQIPKGGWSYSYEFYSGDKHIMTITGYGDKADVNGYEHNVSKPISYDSLANWFNSIPLKTYEE